MPERVRAARQQMPGLRSGVARQVLAQLRTDLAGKQRDRVRQDGHEPEENGQGRGRAPHQDTDEQAEQADAGEIKARAEYRRQNARITDPDVLGRAGQQALPEEERRERQRRAPGPHHQREHQRLHRQHLGPLRRGQERAADQAAGVLAGHGHHAECADEQLRQLYRLEGRAGRDRTRPWRSPTSRPSRCGTESQEARRRAA